MSNSRRAKKLTHCLERLLKISPAHQRIKADPIEFPRRYQDQREIEIAGFVASVLAYGRVELFKQTLEKLFALSEGKLYRYMNHFIANQERPRFKGIYYRFNTEEDLFYLMALMSRVIQDHGSIGTLFLSLYHEADEDIGPTLSRFVAALRKYLSKPISRGLSYLLPSPNSGSACKRLNLFLRWMIRPNDGVDFGLWKEIPADKLIIPLDTHIIRIAQYLELTSRKSPDWKMAKEITNFLKRCDPHDPLKYDFSLCHLGISEACPIAYDPQKCQVCPLEAVCHRDKPLLKV